MAQAKDSMIRSTAGSNTEKWAGKKYKSKKKARAKVAKMKAVAKNEASAKVKAYLEQRKRKNRYTGPKRVTPLKKKSSY